MSPDEQVIAIARATMAASDICNCGLHWMQSDGVSCGNSVANFPTDLNAIRQAVLKLFPNQVHQGFYHPLWNELMDNLKVATGHFPDHWNEYDLMTASAAAWSQAIVKTIGKWKESQC